MIASGPIPESAQARGNASAPVWPRITLVTAVRNGARYLEDTVRSVISQGYPNLEYIIVDGVSTDGTLDIIRKYERDIAWWSSQPDSGMYDALNKGYSHTTGEIMGWLNSGDLLHANGLFVVGSVFAAFKDVEWITGRPTVFNAQGMTVQVQPLPRWTRDRFLAGANRHIQQESTYWRRSLWDRAGGALSEAYRAEGDFEQWVRFFRHARLYPVNALIGGYRMHEGSLSHTNVGQYNDQCDEIVERELESMRGGERTKLFRRLSERAGRIRKVRWAWRRLVMGSLYRWPGPDWPPVIEYHLHEARWILSK